MSLRTHYRASLLRRLGLNAVTGRVLDIGGFDGYWAAPLLLIRADGMRLPFKDAVSDVVFAFDVIEHIPNEEPVIGGSVAGTSARRSADPDHAERYGTGLPPGTPAVDRQMVGSRPRTRLQRRTPRAYLREVQTGPRTGEAFGYQRLSVGLPVLESPVALTRPCRRATKRVSPPIHQPRSRRLRGRRSWGRVQPISVTLSRRPRTRTVALF